MANVDVVEGFDRLEELIRDVNQAIVEGMEYSDSERDHRLDCLSESVQNIEREVADIGVTVEALRLLLDSGYRKSKAFEVFDWCDLYVAASGNLKGLFSYPYIAQIAESPDLSYAEKYVQIAAKKVGCSTAEAETLLTEWREKHPFEASRSAALSDCRSGGAVFAAPPYSNA